MTYRLMHIYVQRQELNEEIDIFHSVIDNFNDTNRVLSSVIVINCEETVEDDHEWKGIIQTLKNFILDKVMSAVENTNSNLAKMEANQKKMEAKIDEN